MTQILLTFTALLFIAIEDPPRVTFSELNYAHKNTVEDQRAMMKEIYYQEVLLIAHFRQEEENASFAADSTQVSENPIKAPDYPHIFPIDKMIALKYEIAYRRFLHLLKRDRDQLSDEEYVDHYIFAVDTLGNSKLESHQYSKAISEFNHLLEVTKGTHYEVKAYINLSEIEVHIGDMYRYVDMLQRAVNSPSFGKTSDSKIFQDHLSALNNLAYHKAHIEDYQGSVHDFNTLFTMAEELGLSSFMEVDEIVETINTYPATYRSIFEHAGKTALPNSPSLFSSDKVPSVFEEDTVQKVINNLAAIKSGK